MEGIMIKKIFSISVCMLLMCTTLAACTNNTTQANVSKTLDNNLQKLYKTVTKLDTIDNNYINNPDLQSSYTKSNSMKNIDTIETFSSNYITNENNNEFDNETKTNQIINDILEEQLRERLSLNNNGICNNCNNTYNCDQDGYCENCNTGILCDENGNCVYCNNCLNQNSTNTCENCGKSYLLEKINNVSSDNNLNNDKIGLTDSDLNNYNDNYSIIQLDQTNKIETQNTDAEVSKSESAEQNNTKFYYYTNESFTPVRLKYNPRFVSSYNETDINEQLTTYLYKVQRLYAMTEDAIQANNILNTTKTNLLESIVEIRELNENVINGTCTLTLQQLQALNNYAYDIKNTIKNLKSCDGDLENEVSNINSNIPASIASSVDVMNSNYVKLINLIDTRITYHESAIATLEQIKYLLEDAIGTNNISDEEIIDIIDKLTTTEQIEDNNAPQVSEKLTQINPQSNDKNVDNTISSEDKINLDDEQKSADEDEQKISTLNDNQTVNNETTQDEVIEENVAQNEQIESEDAITQTTKKSIKNIDTYKKNSNIVPPQNQTSDDKYLDIPAENYIAQNSNENVNTLDIVDNNYIVGDNNYGLIDNNYCNNGNYYANNNMYKNSVINQNNLNNNDGYGGYYYGNDGNIRNNGINNNNEFGNNGNTIENNLNRNNNTNTYGYNTMLDIINQGTVNNGINTL